MNIQEPEQKLFEECEAAATPDIAPPKTRRRVKLMAVLLILLGVTGGVGAIAVKFLFNPPEAAPGTERIVEIPAGASLRSAAEILRDAAVIRDKNLFMILARIYRRGKSIKAGEYQFTTAMLPVAVLEKLQDGKIYIRSATIPEGYTARQIAAILAQRGLNEQEFLAQVFDKRVAAQYNVSAESLEGYLFPDTYYLNRGMTVEAIVRKMVQEFWEVMTPDAQQEIQQKGFTVHEIVTLASIIEKEARLPQERELISAVYHNRLRIGMKLDSDPTVIYGIEHFNGNLTRVDLQTDTPYNTYKRRGLPPGPIASPGQAALLAAIRPAAVNYLYFVARNDGSHQFSATYAEHQRAVREYQKNRRKRHAQAAAANK